MSDGEEQTLNSQRRQRLKDTSADTQAVSHRADAQRGRERVEEGSFVVARESWNSVPGRPEKRL